MGQGSVKFTKEEEQFGEFCYYKTQKLGKNHNFGAFGVISEIQRAKFGVFVTYIFGGKIWGSDMNFRHKIWGQVPPTSLYGSTPSRYSVQILLFFLKIWVQVDKPVKILAKEKIFGNLLCVCGCGGNCQIIYNCTYLLPSKFFNEMIKSELNNGFAKSGVVNMPTPP